MDKQHVRFILTLIGILAALWAIDPSFTATVVMPVTVTYLRFLSRRRQTQGCYTGGGNPPLVIAPERITMATRVVGDITRVNPGTEGELLKNMLDQLGSNEYQIDI